jgi:hypothetical protein
MILAVAWIALAYVALLAVLAALVLRPGVRALAGPVAALALLGLLVSVAQLAGGGHRSVYIEPGSPLP